MSNAGQKSFEHLIGIFEGSSPLEGGFITATKTESQFLSTYDPQRAQKLFALLAKNQTWQCPTLVWERGELADLALLDANPLDNIANTQKIAAVIVNRRYLSRAELDKTLAGVVAAANSKQASTVVRCQDEVFSALRLAVFGPRLCGRSRIRRAGARAVVFIVYVFSLHKTCRQVFSRVRIGNGCR